MPRLLEADYDVIIVELDSNPEHALDLVESICSSSAVTVMVYSEQVHPEMLVRCMRAGAREFLTHPITSELDCRSDGARIGAAPGWPTVKEGGGQAAGVCRGQRRLGVTTVASNFAVALARESGQSTVLIDLNLPLGDAALGLGLTPQYSTANALHELQPPGCELSFDSAGETQLGIVGAGRAGQVHHGAASRKRPSTGCCLWLARTSTMWWSMRDRDFDAASKSLFAAGSHVYLVLQVGVSELRNANRLISEFSRRPARSSKLC